MAGEVAFQDSESAGEIKRENAAHVKRKIYDETHGTLGHQTHR